MSAFLASDRRIEERQHARLLAVQDVPLTPFQSDGCSGGLSRVWNSLPDLLQVDPLPFEACCVTHDRAYHSGGGQATARGSYMARVAADRAFHGCVAQEGGSALAEGLYQAVRLGGQPCSGLSWRWGYGRPACR